jgi:glycosyltransferase involved in cell wall biosynthesis
MQTLFSNYHRQQYKHKELIVILNSSKLDLNEYYQAARRCSNVSVYRLPEHVSLGQCLNYGVSAAKYSFIAKMDDDDYYAPGYLTDAMATMRRTGADIVGKRAHFMYLSGRKLLLLRYTHQANKTVRLVQGATLLVKRPVFDQVLFRDRDLGECVRFCTDCIAKGFTLYSGSPYQFAAIRRRNSKNHTWIVSDKQLLSRNARILRVRNWRKYVGKG